MKSVIYKSMIVIAGLLLGSLAIAQDLSVSQEAVIEERIQPVGDVCLQGDSSCGAVTADTGGAARSGEDIYNASCMACHATGAAGAPKFGDSNDWGSRVANHGLEGVYEHAIVGFNGMPPKGLCMDCTDEELTETVDYMLENSK